MCTSIVFTDNAVQVYWTAGRLLRDGDVAFWILGAAAVPLLIAPYWFPPFLVLPALVGALVIPLALWRYRRRPWLVLTHAPETADVAPSSMLLASSDIQAVRVSTGAHLGSQRGRTASRSGAGTSTVYLQVRGERPEVPIFTGSMTAAADVESLAKRLGDWLGVPVIVRDQLALDNG